MKTESDIYHDRSDWQRGEWDDEPDRMQWTDEETGYPCLIVRNPFGALCGYVGVPAGHQFHGNGYWESEGGPDVDVHGGLTYANKCQEAGKICHKVEPGEPDDVWWFGFDCAHHSDYFPGSHIDLRLHGLTYRNLRYVQGEVRSLASQLKALA